MMVRVTTIPTPVPESQVVRRSAHDSDHLRADARELRRQYSVLLDSGRAKPANLVPDATHDEVVPQLTGRSQFVN